jgi:hypothetical protein
MKVGLSVRIDVTKIDKERLYKGEKGTYLDLTTFVDTAEQDQYENNGFISQSVDKEEREKGVQTPILGNVKVFYTDGSEQPSTPQAKQAVIDEDIPF